MKQKQKLSTLLFILILLLQEGICFAENPLKNDRTSSTKTFKELKINNFEYGSHNDSIHKFNFRYADKKRGLKPYIVPTLLISTGTALHFMTETKENFRDFTQSNFVYRGKIDDYSRYAPIVAVYTLQAFGVKGKNNFGNVTAITAKSLLLNAIITDRLKYGVNETRPSGGKRSFPSAHTSVAFSLAHVMHKEYGEKSVWYSIGAYSCAASVGFMRVAKDAHWISDVFAGAGIGIITTELIYLTHQYKWNSEHIKRLDIFPFRVGKQKGISMVYTF